jgi:hypothetical protein
MASHDPTLTEAVADVVIDLVAAEPDGAGPAPTDPAPAGG